MGNRDKLVYVSGVNVTQNYIFVIGNYFTAITSLVEILLKKLVYLNSLDTKRLSC